MFELPHARLVRGELRLQLLHLVRVRGEGRARARVRARVRVKVSQLLHLLARLRGARDLGGVAPHLVRVRVRVLGC